MPREPCVGSVLTTTPTRPACRPFEMNVFEPLMTYSSPVAHRARPDRLQVGARARLGHRDRADEFARGHARQPVLLLRLGTVVEHVVRDDAVHRVPEARDAVAAHFLGHDGLVAHVAADTAVFRRDVRAQQADFARLAPELAVDVMLLAPARVVRNDFHLDEAPDGVTEEVQLVVEPGGTIGIHGVHLAGADDDKGNWSSCPEAASFAARPKTGLAIGGDEACC